MPYIDGFGQLSESVTCFIGNTSEFPIKQVSPAVDAHLRERKYVAKATRARRDFNVIFCKIIILFLQNFCSILYSDLE